MGSGCYSYSMASFKAKTLKNSYDAYAATHGDYAARQQVFKQREIDPEMDIKGKVRECLDTAEHPNTVPVIIALDVTGSMGSVPSYLIQEAFPEIMKKIQDEGIQDVQVCFMGVGDHYYDDAPIQVGQFESSDDLMEKWLTKLWLEGGGGGNDGESYLLAWYAALHCTSCDAITKGRGGILITVGDEPNLKTVDVATLSKFFGDAQSDVTARNMLKDLQEIGWNVYHINVSDYAGCRKSTKTTWEEALGNHVVHTQSGDGKDIIDIIAGIVTSCVRKDSGKKPVTSSTDEILGDDNDIL